jgi:hypothetical protein
MLLTIIQILASPIIIGILGWVYFRTTNKKINSELIQQFFEKILTLVKISEKDLNLNISTNQLDPRMQKALEIFIQLKTQLPIKLAAKKLNISLDKLKLEEVQDLFEKLLHAKKLALNFNVVTEIKNK